MHVLIGMGHKRLAWLTITIEAQADSSVKVTGPVYRPSSIYRLIRFDATALWAARGSRVRIVSHSRVVPPGPLKAGDSRPSTRETGFKGLVASVTVI